MSHSLARLREVLDDPLLVPSGRRMVATPRAEAIAAKLPAALEQLESALHQPQPFDPATARARFSIATLDYFELTALPDVLGHLRRVAPGIDLEVLRLGADTPAKMARGEIDLALGSTSSGFGGRGLRSHDLFEVEFSVIARADHPGIGRSLSLDKYTELQHVLVSVEGRSEGVVDRELLKLGRTRRVALRVPHFMSAPLAVASSDMICTVASNVAERGRTLLGLRVFRPPLPLPAVGVRLWWPRQHDEDPAKRWLRELFVLGKVFPARLRRQIVR